MVYSIGVKELWEVPKGRLPRGAVIHTMGYPLDTQTFGGGFVYGFTEERIALGLVVGLDYKDPFLDPHALFQSFKEHPLLREMLAGGKMVRYGARTISEPAHDVPPALNFRSKTGTSGVTTYVEKCSISAVATPAFRSTFVVRTFLHCPER